MQAKDTHHFIERTYREGGRFQWVRETVMNAIEAEASRIEFGIEWQAVESQNVYRRTITDDGCGMTADELVEFFNTYGGGGKPIGGVHENFGVGAKTSLLPWNHHGVVVISWIDGEASMIRVQQNAETGEYGLRVEDVVDENDQLVLEAVYEPFYDEEAGCDWSMVKPDWIDSHGTVIVLLGNDPTDDTVLGDPERDESDIKGISAYLNRRWWTFPGDLEVYVDELRTQDRGSWPRSLEQARGGEPQTGTDRRTNKRSIEGAKHYVEYPVSTFNHGRLKASGTVPLQDTEVDWYLWDGKRPRVDAYASIGGYIAALYQDELYDVSNHHATYRTFGVTESEVRKNLWLIVRPPELDENNGKHGVYPRTDRNSLLLKGGPSAGQPLPFSDWGAQFADQLPDEILDAIREARGSGGGSIKDDYWRERLAERFGSRWRIIKLRAEREGKLSVNATQRGSRPRSARSRRKTRGSSGSGGTGGRGGTRTIGDKTGKAPAEKKKVGGGIPTFRAVPAADIEGEMLAAWAPNDPESESGAVLLNKEHAVIEERIEYFQSQYADHHAEAIAEDVIQAYGEVAVSKIAHSEYLKQTLPAEVVEGKLRTNEALTLALLGLMAEETLIATRLGKYGKKRTA